MKRSALVAGWLCFAAAPPVFATDLAIVGTGDGISVLRSLSTAFSIENPKVRVLIPPSIHSSGGVREIIAGRAVLGRVARSLTSEEDTFGIVVTPIFRQPAAIFVHPSAKVTSLRVEELSKIYSGAITVWSEVGGSDLRIRVVRREEVDSTLAVLRQTLPGWKTLTFLERSKIATTTQDAFDTVENVEGAIGFGPYSVDLEKRFTVLRLDGHHPSDAHYPSSVTLSLIHRPGTVTDEARRFIDFVFSPRAKAIMRTHGVVPVDKPFGR